MRFRRGIQRSLLACLATLIAALMPSSFAQAEGAGPNGSGFQEHMLKIPVLKRDTEELETAIKHLIEEKREADDEAQVRQLTTEIAEKYQALKETGEKLEREMTLVRFHYPEQAETLDRKYIRFKTKSLRDIASEVGIDGKLDRIHSHVLATFPVPEIEAKKLAGPRINPVFLRKPASLEPEDVPEKIVLKK